MLYVINAQNHKCRPNGAIVVDKNTLRVVGYAPCFFNLKGLHIDRVKALCEAAKWSIEEYQGERDDTETSTYSN